MQYRRGALLPLGDAKARGERAAVVEARRVPPHPFRGGRGERKAKGRGGALPPSRYREGGQGVGGVKNTAVYVNVDSAHGAPRHGAQLLDISSRILCD